MATADETPQPIAIKLPVDLAQQVLDLLMTMPASQSYTALRRMETEGVQVFDEPNDQEVAP